MKTGDIKRVAQRAEVAARDAGRPAGWDILLIEDEPEMRRLLAAFLGRAGYRAMALARASEAFRRMQEGFRPDLLVTDLALPDLSGLALLQDARALYPDLPALLITGYDVAARSGVPPGTRVLLKPFSRAAFMAQVSALIAGRA